MTENSSFTDWSIIAYLTDKTVLNLDGMSNKPPRKTSRAIVINEDGKYAVVYAKKYDLYSLPGGGIEEGEDEYSALTREIDEETGCTCDSVKQLGIVSENRAHMDFTCLSYYFIVNTLFPSGKQHLTEGEEKDGISVLWFSLEEVIHLIRM